MTAPLENCPIPPEELPPNVRKVVEKGPTPLRMMTARGMAPSPPRDLVLSQFVLLWDAEPPVAQAAEKSLAELDARLANGVLGDPQLHPALLSHLAALHASNEAYVEKLLLNPALPASAVVAVAETCSERMISDHIVPNQARLLAEPEIARALTKNPAALKSDIDRTVDFLVRSGAVVEGLKEFEEALMRLGGEDRLAAAQKVSLPNELLDERFMTDEEKSERAFITEDEEGTEDEEEDITIEQRLRNMTAAEKVAFATRGNKTVRTLLMRDTNRLVALAAVSSPAITEPEIVAAANNKAVHQDVVGHIVRDKKNNWTKNYQVKVALVNNPKTPLSQAMKFVPTLRPKDLKAVSKSKNVPAGIRNLANNLTKARR